MIPIQLAYSISKDWKNSRGHRGRDTGLGISTNCRSARMAQPAERETPDLGAVGSSPMMGVEIRFKKKGGGA